MAANEQGPQGGDPQAERQPAQDEPKIILPDDDWKAQAQAEKERLAKEVETEQPAGGAAAGNRRAGPREVPPASFTTLVSSLVTQALFSLGAVQDRQGRRYVDLELAKHHIDTLSVLEEKTKGNLSAEEKRLLDNALYQARMQYVQIAQNVSV